MATSRIVSFDMNNEVFQTIRLPQDYCSDYVSTTIFAKDEHSFWRFDSSTELSTFLFDKFVTIYESRCEGRELSWNRMMVVNLEAMTLCDISRHPWTPPSGCVILELYSGVFVYDYRYRRFIRKLSIIVTGSQYVMLICYLLKIIYSIFFSLDYFI